MPSRIKTVFASTARPFVVYGAHAARFLAWGCRANRPTRALFTPVPPPVAHTGGQAYNAQVIKALHHAGYSVWALPVPYRGLPGARYTLLRNMARLPAVVQGLLSGRKVLVVASLAHPSNLVIHFAVCRVLPCCRVITVVHHLESDEPGRMERRTRLRMYERAALTLSDTIVVNSPFTAKRLAALGLGRAAVTLIAPGFEPSSAQPVRRAPGMHRLLSVGKLTPRKANDQLLIALSLLPASYIVDLVGVADDPAYERSLREMVQELGLDKRVCFHGYSSAETLAELRAAADLYVSTSVWEGFGMAVAEAMGMGLPVVAVDTAPVRALVEGEGSGIIVQPHDPAALAEAIQQVVNDPSYQAAALARSAKVRDRYSWAAMRRAFAALLEQYDQR